MAKPTDMVVMTHPDVAVPSGATSRKAYEALYRPLGWVLADEQDKKPAPASRAARKRSAPASAEPEADQAEKE